MRLPKRWWLAVGAAVALGVAVRAWHVLSQPFPLNDGAMFFAMTRDLQQAHYHLPLYTSYNARHIPYAYSPLGFYLAGAASDLLHVGLFDVFRWLPLIVTSLTLTAFVYLGRGLLRSRFALVTATVAFALLPRSFIWMLMGGGVTRSLGFLFGILTLAFLHRAYASPERMWRYVALAALAGGGVLLSHLGTATFVVSGAILFWLAFGRRRFATLATLAAGAGALVVSAPWWGTVIARHGLGPFLAASATGGSIFRDGFSVDEVLWWLSHSGLGTGESVLSLIGMLAVVGFFAALAERRPLVPGWWLAIIVLDARQGSTFATVPIALLAGVGVADVLYPALRRPGLAPWTARDSVAAGVAIPAAHPSGSVGWALARTRGRFAEVLLGLLLLFAAATAVTRRPVLTGGLPDLVSLSAEERGALRWVARETPDSSRVLVVANSPWEIDKNSEWMPVLGRRQSVATVQGYEWLPIGSFATKKREYVALQGCAGWTDVCLDDWARGARAAFTHVYLPKTRAGSCCRMLVASLLRDPRYELVYDGSGASVFARRSTSLALGDTVY